MHSRCILDGRGTPVGVSIASPAADVQGRLEPCNSISDISGGLFLVG